jgi:hypothetical protein
VYLQALCEFPQTSLENIEPEMVGLDCAVTLVNRSNDKYILILENRLTSELKADEINPDHAKFKVLNGKKVGDQVEFEGSLTNWTIEKLNNKFNHAYWETEYQIKTKYAETSEIKSFHVDDFWDVIEKMKQDEGWHQDMKKLRADYYANKRTLGTVAMVYGRSVIDVWQEFSGSDKGVRVAMGNPEEMQLALSSISSGKKICADITSLLTLFQLDCAGNLLEETGKLYITESTFDLVFNFEKVLSVLRRKGTGKNQATEFLQFVKRNTLRLQPKELMGVNWLEQKEMHQWLGVEFYETAILAKELGAVLYSDDFAFRNYACKTYQLRGTWTQAVLNHMQLNDKLLDSAYELANLTLIKLGYKHTSITQWTFLEAFKETNYQVEGVTERCIDVLTGSSSSLETACPVGIETLVQLWKKSDVDRKDKVYLTRTIFIALFTRPFAKQVLINIKKLMIWHHEQANSTESTMFIFEAGKILEAISSDFQIGFSK